MEGISSLYKIANLSQLLTEKQTVFNLKGATKKEVIIELVNCLFALKLLKNKSLTVARIMERERLESTGIGYGLAFPHARIETERNLIMAMGRSVKGINFKSLDGKPAHLIFLIIWMPYLPALFNQLFGGLVRALRNPGRRETLIKAKSLSEMVNKLSEIKLKISPDVKELHIPSLLTMLQDIMTKKKRAKKKELQQLDKQIEMIREEIDTTILWRFDRLMEKYGHAVVKVKDGVCLGCQMRLSIGLHAAMRGVNSLFVCENCGKFIQL